MLLLFKKANIENNCSAIENDFIGQIQNNRSFKNSSLSYIIKIIPQCVCFQILLLTTAIDSKAKIFIWAAFKKE